MFLISYGIVWLLGFVIYSLLLEFACFLFLWFIPCTCWLTGVLAGRLAGAEAYVYIPLLQAALGCLRLLWDALGNSGRLRLLGPFGRFHLMLSRVCVLA